MALLRTLTLVFLFIIRSRFPKSKPLSEITCYRYGNYMLKFIRKFEKLDFRLRKINVNIEFLNSCLENDLRPTFLRYKMSSKRLQNSESYKRSQRMFLQEEETFKTVEKEKSLGKYRKLKMI